MSSNFKSGILPNIDSFNKEEQKILKHISSKYWLITRVQSVSLANSDYKLVLLKPSPEINVAFNLHREIVLAFSSYGTFEPRSIDALEYFDVQELRLEEICSIIVSRDNDIQSRLNTILKSNQEARIIIPFSYSELLENIQDEEYVINKIRENFYTRDLFGIQDALKKDLYFFGRRDLIHTLINKHLSSENAGIFGLRKTGKTSILYGIQRALDRKSSISVFIDCQTLHLKPWNLALYSIIQQLQNESQVRKNDLKTQTDYEDSRFAADSFHEDITKISQQKKKSILLIFDEIENITFDTSASTSWKDGTDFIKFWQVIRSSFQRNLNKNIFTYLITGTNPICIEKPTIGGVDNPIFSQFQPTYIPPFDFQQTKEMLDKLGGYMGLVFDEITCGKIVEDFGGHPLLMRQMCSYMHKNIASKRPVQINKIQYKALKSNFYKEEDSFNKYAKMVLEVLENWYQDEYQMLKWLSIGDITTFEGLAKEAPEYINHLMKYGILEESNQQYIFKIEALKEYLAHKNKYKRLNLSNTEKQDEISRRRNDIEPILRRIVKTQLRAGLGEEIAKKKIITELYGAKEISRLSPFEYSVFFDSNKHNIYLSNLFELIRKNWQDCFKNIFDVSVDIFDAKTKLINYYRKTDAHASQISDADFQTFRGAMEWLEGVVDNY